MKIKINLSGHENTVLAGMGFLYPGALQVDLADADLPQKIVAFLKQECAIDSESEVVLVTPGLAPLAVLVIAAIHGITGHFPVVVPLVRGENGFVPSTPVNLQEFRNGIREQREGVVKL